MKTLMKITILATTFTSVFGIILSAQAATINVPINTGTTGKAGLKTGAVDPVFTWNYTGNYQDPRYQTYIVDDNSNLTWIMKGGNISFNNNYGADVPSNMPSFYGVAYLFNTFELPQDATNIQLDFSAIASDDRVVLSLNGNELTRTAFALPAYTSASGKMMDGNGNYVSKTFDGNGWEGNFNFNNPNLFNIGGTNIVKLWVNNTDSTDPNANAIPLKNLAWTDIRGNLSYSTPDPKSVPEASTTLGLLALGIAGTVSFSKGKKVQSC